MSHMFSMAAPRPSKRPKRTKAIAPSMGDRDAVARLAGVLDAAGSPKAKRSVQIVDDAGRRLDIPRPLADVIARAASLLAEGRSVTVTADDDMVTTQAAADRLNVSRQYVVRLIDRGELPAVKVGSHRRLRVSDVETFRMGRDAKRDAALNRLAAVSEEIGGYRFAR